MYVKKRQRSSKLEGKWLPYYRILEKRTPVTYIIENTLDKSTEKYTLNICALQIWNGKSQKARTYQQKLDMSSTLKIQMTALVTQNQIRPPLHKIADKYCHEREGSSDEDDIPLMELAKRLRARESNDPSQDSEEDKKMDIDLAHKKDEYKNHVKNILKSVVGFS